MIAENCQIIGKLSRTHGFNGELILTSDKDLDKAFLKTEMVFLLIDCEPVPFFISAIKEKSDTSVIIRFDHVNCNEDSEEFIGVQVLLPQKKKNRRKLNPDSKVSIIGYDVVDHIHGNIGQATQFFFYPGNPLLEVRKGLNEYLIPVHDDIISEIDDALKCIYINAPEGLLGLK